MGKLTYWTIKENEDLIDDDLIKNAIKLLQKRFDKITKYIKENYPEKICECGCESFTYYHHKAICDGCKKEIVKKLNPIEYSKLGVTSRKLPSIIKELFALELGKKRKSEKPTKNQLRNLKYSIDNFNTGEYTDSEVKFLTKRYNELLEESGKAKGTDPTMLRSLVIKELQIQNIERKEATGYEVNRNKIKDIYKIYMDLSKELNISKNTRKDDKEKNILSSLISEDEELNEDLSLNKEFERHMQELNKMEEYKKLAKVRREKVGNMYG